MNIRLPQILARLSVLVLPGKPQSVVLLALVFLGAARCSAHDPGLSTITIQLGRDRFDATLVLSSRDARELALQNTDAPAGDDSVAGALGNRRTMPCSAVLDLLVDGKAVPPGETSYVADDQANAALRFVFVGRPHRSLEIRSRCLASLPAGHRQFLCVRAPDQTVLAERLLSAGASVAFVEMPPAGSAGTSDTGSGRGFAFIGLGLKHILLGYDHLLFLISLLVVTRRFMPTLKMVTCFTVAHSITLALATLDLVSIPSRIVEPLIAASIVFVAVENILHRDARGSRLFLVFGFGLIHGLGFASVLRELGIGDAAAGIVVPLLSFNLGVELGQLLVVLVVAPLLVWAARMPILEKRLVPVSSTIVGAAGFLWLVERLFASA